MLPFALVSGGLLVVPVALACYLAFTNVELIGPTATSFNFTGLINWDRLTADPLFIHSLFVTLIFVIVGTVILQTLLGGGIALLLERGSPVMRPLVTSLAVVAWIIPEVVVAFIWYGLAQPSGVVDGLLRTSAANYLISAPLAMVIAANLWHNIAFSLLVFSAGLRGLPQDLMDAASIDGASYLSRLRHVVVPLLRATLGTNIILSVLQSLSVFTLIYVLTQGGPANATLTLPVYIYIEGFTNNALGYATLIGVVLLVLGCGFGFFMVRNISKEIRP
ncbi:MAG: carbohydrate ABC transporter permease [Acidimicrobiales bacterium]